MIVTNSSSSDILQRGELVNIRTGSNEMAQNLGQDVVANAQPCVRCSSSTCRGIAPGERPERLPGSSLRARTMTRTSASFAVRRSRLVITSPSRMNTTWIAGDLDFAEQV